MGPDKTAPVGTLLYALPRTVASTSVEIEGRRYVPGLLDQATYASALNECKPNTEYEPTHVCYWGFKKKQLVQESFDWKCPEPAANQFTHFRLRKPEDFEVGAVPDSSAVFAVDLKPGLFESLHSSLRLSPDGLALGLKASSVSAGGKLLDFSLAAARVAVAGYLGGAPDATPAGLATLGLEKDIEGVAAQSRFALSLLPPDRLSKIASQMAALELARVQSLAQHPDAAPLTADIERQILQLRGVVEGVIESSVDTVPVAASNSSGSAEGAEVFKGSKFQCRDRNIGVSAALRPHPNHAWSIASMRVVDESSSADDKAPDGVRYRVPAAGSLVVSLALQPVDKPCTRDAVGECLVCARSAKGECIEYVSDPFLVAQFGKVRALPRRLGLTGGTLNIDLDPLTGALVSIETKMGEGGPAAVGSVLTQIDRDVTLEQLKDDQEALELEAKRCASLRTLRRPLPPECPETAGP